MTAPNSKTTLIDYCKRRLGEPVIEINVDEQQAEDRIDEALQYYQEFHSDATVKGYMKHQVTEDDKNFVMEVLDGDFLTQGPFVSKVEEYMSNLTNKKYGVMCSNGTAALHLVAEMLNQDSKIVDKNIITTPLTFVADANFGRYINAEIRFADIDSDTWTIDHQV